MRSNSTMLSPHILLARRVPGLLAIIVALAAMLAPVSPAMAQPQTSVADQSQTSRDTTRLKPAHPKAADLPVTRVVLYASGVGYFERAGSVTGDRTLTLTFDKDQINDVLKSMVMTDLGGGHIQSVTYPSREPVSHALQSFGVDLSGNPSLPDLLNQLRGSKVAVHAPDKISGKILNVTGRTKVVGEPPAKITEHVLNLVTAGGIRAISLDSVQRLELQNDKLSGELNQALGLLAESHNRDRRPVELRFTGKGKRHVAVGYLVETPVWKTSYRLDLSGVSATSSKSSPDEPRPSGSDGAGQAAELRDSGESLPRDRGASGANDSQKQPGSQAAGKTETSGSGGGVGGGGFLQGWAIVENTSDDDWKNVSLSLVSGQPISFRMDLYTPLFVPRPEATIPRYASLQPRVYDEGMERADADATDKSAAVTAMRERLRRQNSAQRKAGARARAANARQRSGLKGPTSAAPEGMSGLGQAQPAAAPGVAGQAFDFAGSGVQSAAKAGDVGELFQFTLKHPVDLARRKSAMLPIVNQPVKAKKLSIYNQNVQPKHPLHGVRLTNDTDLQLPAGPVTVFDGPEGHAAYAGDALIDNIMPGDDRLLSYGLDLDVLVDPSQKMQSQVRAGKIVEGVLEVSWRHDSTHTYKIRNKAETSKTLLIEYPYDADRKLIEPGTYAEKTAKRYRFRVPVQADHTRKFTIRTQRTQWQSVALLDADVNDFLFYTKNGEINKQVRKALLKAADLKRKLTDLQRQLTEVEKQLKQIKDGQSRLRKNLEAVGKSTTLGTRYLSKLSKEEDTIETLQSKSDDLKSKRDEARGTLEDYLENLNIG